MVQMVTAFWTSKSLYVVAKLGVADLLVEGPQTSAKLAEETGAHEPSLYRILRTLASLGVFMEGEDRTFSLRPLSSTLVSDASGSLRDFVSTMGEAPMWRA
jgi:DNA-binding IclR family transcriptional regulator